MMLNLDEIEARAKAATGGKWRAIPSLAPGFQIGNGVGWVGSVYADEPGDAEATATAAFIASARQDVPALIAEVRALRAVVERQEWSIEAFVDHGHEPGQFGVMRHGQCPECFGVRAAKDCPLCPACVNGHDGHAPDCALAAALGR